MSEADLTTEALAAYLHLNLDQVQRLVERRQLPGRRVAGEWRFSRAEINGWLEDRLGLEQAPELARMESALHRFDGTPAAWSVGEMLPLAAVETVLAARTRNSAIDALCEVAARTGWLWDQASLAEAVKRREDMHPTALENGVALLHPRRPQPNNLEQPFLAFGRTGQGIAFGGSRGVLTDLFFLICSQDDAGHLRSLARLSRLISAPGLIESLRGAADPQGILAVIAAAEADM